MSEDGLETRYRRLLAVFPPGYRERYGEEMLDVLLASSAPGQRRPDLREALDLVVSGLRARLGTGVGGGPSPATRSAATVFGFLAAVGFAAMSWYQVADFFAGNALYGRPVRFAALPDRALAMGLGWTLVACAAVAGLRRLAALGAVLGFLGEAVLVGREYDFAPNVFVSSWWLVILTGFVAIGLAVTSGGDGWRRVLRRDADGVRPLGGRAVLALAVGALLAAVEPFVSGALTDIEPVSGGGWAIQSRVPFLPAPGLPYGGLGAGHVGAVFLVITAAVLVLRQRPAVRRRVLVLAAPAAAVVLVVQLWFGGFLESSPRFDPPVYLTAGQWGALVLVPLLVFGAGTWLVHRYERQLASGALLA